MPATHSPNESFPPPSHSLWRMLFSPPYAAVPWAVFIYALLSCLVYTDNGPFTGHIVGFDDQVRMVQVMQWINGGGWYDRLITRVNAPEGFQTIWARIVDIPFALVVIAAQIFTDQRTAPLVASVVVPVIALALMFLTARYMARPIAGKGEARLVVLFLMFTTVLNHRIYTLAGFHIGEASHHAWYGILNIFMFGAAARVVLGVAGWKPRIMLGLAVALLIAVGIEGFPMIAGTAAIIAVLSWAFRNHLLAQRGGEAFGLGALFGLILLPIHVPPSHFFETSFSQPSILGPILITVAALYLLLQSLILRIQRNNAVNALVLIAVAAIFAYGLISAFPGIKGGSLAALSPNERIMASNEHPEVWTMWRVSRDGLDYLSLVMPTAIAVVMGVFAAFRSTNKRRRMMLFAFTGFAALPGGLAQVYWRYVHHAQAAVCPLLLYTWQRVRAHLPKNLHYGLLSFLAFIGLGPFWFVLLPALDTNAPFLTQVAFFPAKIYTEPYSCDTLSMTHFLNKHYPPETRINVPDWDSATFLYESNLQVDFLSNYPSHDHFIDNRMFFQSQDVESARKIALRHQFNLVAVCRQIPYAQSLKDSRPQREPLMIERLVEGTPPPWLKPVFTGITTNYVLYEVDPAALKQGQ